MTKSDFPLTDNMAQIFNCAPRSSKIDMSITNPNEAPSSFVKKAVCVKKPGPIADVAIKNAALSNIVEYLFFI